MSSYTADCTREGAWWVVHVPEIDKTTQARRLDQVDVAVRSLIGLFTDENPKTAEITLVVQIPDDVRAELDAADAAQQEAEREREQAAASLRTAAKILHDRGYTVRDIGSVLGRSHQRAQQLLRDK